MEQGQVRAALDTSAQVITLLTILVYSQVARQTQKVLVVELSGTLGH